MKKIFNFCLILLLIFIVSCSSDKSKSLIYNYKGRLYDKFVVGNHSTYYHFIIQDFEDTTFFFDFKIDDFKETIEITEVCKFYSKKIGDTLYFEYIKANRLEGKKSKIYSKNSQSIKDSILIK
jgi:hypothetical protein